MVLLKVFLVARSGLLIFLVLILLNPSIPSDVGVACPPHLF